MNVVEHFFIGWCIANTVPSLSNRERTIVTIAAVIPDIDGLGMLMELATRNSAHPLLWWTDYHHVVAHNIGFAMVVALGSWLLSSSRVKTTVLTVVSFHSHILGDILGARGPDGYQWPIPYFIPFSRTPALAWEGQWALNAWQNFVITGAAVALTLVLAWRRGYSPVGIVSRRADAAFVKTLRARFNPPDSAAEPDANRAADIRPEDTARFRVQGHIEITARGAYLMGNVEEGTVRIGAAVETSPALTIATIEFMDKRSTRESWVCLRFAEAPAKSELERRFPVGIAVIVHTD